MFKTSIFKSHAILCAGLIWGQLMVCAGAFADRNNDDFPESIFVDGHQMKLQGAGTLKYKGLIRVYDAALYTGSNGARRLEVLYRLGAKAERFNNAGRDVLERNYSPSVLNTLNERIETINSWYPDPEKGDRCSITYLPGKGTTLSFNGEQLGTIDGDDFAEVYFSIWLGEDPASPKLRDALLNTTKDEKDKQS